MPLYEYECEACAGRFEVIQKFSDPHVDTCTRCGKGPIRRLLSTPAIQFKGTGWYVTDYAQKSKPAAGGGGDKGGTETDTKGTKDAGDSTTAPSTDAGGAKTESKASTATTPS